MFDIISLVYLPKSKYTYLFVSFLLYYLLFPLPHNIYKEGEMEKAVIYPIMRFNKKLRDPNAPKRNMSTYLLYQNAMRETFKEQVGT